MKLDRLKKIDLRKAWNHEAIDFTRWLAEKENLSLLSDEIGLDIVLIQTEASVGKFNVDILAEEENTGQKIVIENQLEMTDHDHLGKIVTYASGYDAEVIIWIVKDVREEHKRAVDWLNEHTDENINFFAIKMELWQIGDSPVAPKFHIISQPNDWAKAIKQSTAKGGLTDTKMLQLDFWTKLREYGQENGSKMRFTKPQPQHWYNLSLGHSDAHLSLNMNTQANLISCEVYISDSKDLFYGLREYQKEIEDTLNLKLEWMELEGKKASRIKITREADISKTEDWEKYFEWFLEVTKKFQDVFGKYVKKVRDI
jgi:hypothetical protein